MQCASDDQCHCHCNVISYVSQPVVYNHQCTIAGNIMYDDGNVTLVQCDTRLPWHHWCSYSEVRPVLMTFLSNSQDILMCGPLPLTLMMLDKPRIITIRNMTMSGWYNLLRLSGWWSENYLVFRWVHHQYYNVWAQCAEYHTHNIWLGW